MEYVKMATDFDSPEMLKAFEQMEQGNYSSAFQLLVPLAQSGNPKAQCNLATIYHLGLAGIDVNGQKAVELYRQVAEQNIVEGQLSAISCNNLAQIFLTGL